MPKYDLFVIGAGSGGVSSARYAASLGAKVGICEKDRVGGTCVIRGCIPKKLLYYASHVSQEVEESRYYGWALDSKGFDWAKLIENKDKEIDRLNQIYLNLLDKSGVDLIEGEAKFIDEHTVDVSGQKITADKFLIATGSWPFMPEIPGIEYAISSNEAFHLRELPKRVAIVGGGYIAVEFAGIFNGLGSDVKLLYRSEQILRGFDRDIRNHLAREIVKKGIDLRLNTNVTQIEKLANGFKVGLTDASSIEVDKVMFATGRKPNINGLNLDDIRVKTAKNGAIIVNEYSQTSVENIYAVGDVTDRMNLTPVAINEGRAFVDTVFGDKPRSLNYEIIPAAVFSQPGVGTCGLTEEKAREKYQKIRVFKSEFRPLKLTITESKEKTFMKLIVDEETDRVVGVHMVGADAAEIVQGVAIALTCGASKSQFDQTVGIHPSSAEEFVTMRS